MPVYNVVHKAYRTLYGWSLELPYVGGERITIEQLKDLVEKKVLFIWKSEDIVIATACVERNIDKEKGDLSLFSVLPEYQSQGIGRKILLECLEYMKSSLFICKCRILVLDVRLELIEMYKKFGFIETSERIPFVLPQFSKAGDLFFIVMEKQV